MWGWRRLRGWRYEAGQTLCRRTSVDQLCHRGDEALGYRNGLASQLGGYVRTGAGFVIGNRLEIVCEAEEGTQLIIDAPVILDEPMKFRVDAPMGFRCLSGSLRDQRLSGMESGKIGRASGRVIIVHRQHAISFVEQLVRLGKEVSGASTSTSSGGTRGSRPASIRCHARRPARR